MQWLPPIVVNDVEHFLPLCDATSAALLGVMTSELCQVPGIARTVLSRDPALTLWTVWQASMGDGAEVSSLREAAAWLHEHRAALPSLFAEPIGTPAKRGGFTKRAAISHGVLQLVRSRNGRGRQRDEARLLAVIHRPADWTFINSSRARKGMLKRHLPAPLSQQLRQLEGGKTRRGSPIDTVRRAARKWSRLTVKHQRCLSRRARIHWRVRIPTLRHAWQETCLALTSHRQLAADFEDRLRSAKLASLKEFAYGAGHEINNPLANISSRAQTLLRDETDPERRRRVAAINSQAFRAHEMISDLMLFAHPPAPQIRCCELGQIGAAAVEELSQLAEDREVQVRYDAKRTVTMRADPDLILVAIKEIVRNAIEASKSGAVVHVETRSGENGDPFAEVIVRDQGHGLDDRAAEHLFDPYFCGREAGSGLGFGLSKAWRIAELHHGDLLWHGDAQGTSFRLRIRVTSAAGD